MTISKFYHFKITCTDNIKSHLIVTESKWLDQISFYNYNKLTLQRVDECYVWKILYNRRKMLLRNVFHWPYLHRLCIILPISLFGLQATLAFLDLQYHYLPLETFCFLKIARLVEMLSMFFIPYSYQVIWIISK